MCQDFEYYSKIDLGKNQSTRLFFNRISFIFSFINFRGNKDVIVNIQCNSQENISRKFVEFYTYKQNLREYLLEIIHSNLSYHMSRLIKANETFSKGTQC